MKTLLALLSSKKFVSALLTMIGAVAVKWGMPDMDIKEILALMSPVLLYIGAQGVADHGKSKAQVEATPEQEPTLPEQMAILQKMIENWGDKGKSDHQLNQEALERALKAKEVTQP